MAVTMNRIANANVLINGDTFMGSVKEMTLPNIQAKVEEFTYLGGVGTAEFFSGLEKMEGTITWNSINPDVVEQFGSFTQTLDLQVRGNQQVFTAQGLDEEVPVVIFMKVSSKGLDLSEFKPMEQTTHESGYSCNYLKIERDGENLLEINIAANIYTVKGVDQLAAYRANIGQ